MNPKAPAAAYKIIAGYLSEIDPDYLIRPTPSAGVSIEATGCDGVTTFWLLPDGTAARLHAKLNADIAIRFLRAFAFVGSERI